MPDYPQSREIREVKGQGQVQYKYEGAGTFGHLARKHIIRVDAHCHVDFPAANFRLISYHVPAAVQTSLEKHGGISIIYRGVSDLQVLIVGH